MPCSSTCEAVVAEQNEEVAQILGLHLGKDQVEELLQEFFVFNSTHGPNRSSLDGGQLRLEILLFDKVKLFHTTRSDTLLRHQHCAIKERDVTQHSHK